MDHKSFLLELPYEVRMHILSYALKVPGTVELQQPVWVSPDTYVQPLFQVCRALRSEAILAFYEANTFLYIINTANSKINPPGWPKHVKSQEIDQDPNDELVPTSPLPWKVLDVGRYINHLRLNISLSSSNLASSHQCFGAAVRDFIAVFHSGTRLSSLMIGILSMDSRATALLPEHRETLLLLNELQIKGEVGVRVLGCSLTLRQEIQSLGIVNGEHSNSMSTAV